MANSRIKWLGAPENASQKEVHKGLLAWHSVEIGEQNQRLKIRPVCLSRSDECLYIPIQKSGG